MYEKYLWFKWNFPMVIKLIVHIGTLCLKAVVLARDGGLVLIA